MGGDIANLSTPGYRAQTVTFAPYRNLALSAVDGGNATPLGSIAGGGVVSATTTDWNTGPLQSSGSPLAVAINGPGFFGVQTPAGVEYTRAGDFSFNASGTLVTPDGYPVLSTTGGPLQVSSPHAAAIASINASGHLVSGGQVVGQVAVFAPSVATLGTEAQSLFQLSAGSAPPAQITPNLNPGFVEGSNVDLVAEMASLMRLDQAFASDQTAVQTAQQTMTTAISQVGKVS